MLRLALIVQSWRWWQVSLQLIVIGVLQPHVTQLYLLMSYRIVQEQAPLRDQRYVPVVGQLRLSQSVESRDVLIWNLLPWSLMILCRLILIFADELQMIPVAGL